MLSELCIEGIGINMGRYTTMPDDLKVGQISRSDALPVSSFAISTKRSSHDVMPVRTPISFFRVIATKSLILSTIESSRPGNFRDFRCTNHGTVDARTSVMGP